MAPQFLLYCPVISSDDAPVISGSAITILVGTAQQKFTVHEAPLRTHSGFFGAVLGHDWKERREGVMKLPEEKPDAFNTYVQWLYTSRIVYSDQMTSFDEMFEHYVMGARLQDPAFQDAMMDAIISGVCSASAPIPDEKCVEIVYSNTMAGDPARYLLVGLWARYSRESWSAGGKMITFTEGMGEFFHDLARAQINHDGGYVFRR